MVFIYSSRYNIKKNNKGYLSLNIPKSEMEKKKKEKSVHWKEKLCCEYLIKAILTAVKEKDEEKMAVTFFAMSLLHSKLKHVCRAGKKAIKLYKQTNKQTTTTPTYF